MVGIIILNYNNISDIINCIDSLCETMSMTDVKILVMDNGSSMDVRTKVGNYLQEKFRTMSYTCIEGGDLNDKSIDLPKMTYQVLPSNIGYARGNNEGIKLLSMDPSISEVLILNSDIILTEDILPPLLNHLNLLDNVGAISPLLRKPDGRIDYCCARKSLAKQELLLTFSYVGAKKYQKALDNRKC